PVGQLVVEKSRHRILLQDGLKLASTRRKEIDEAEIDEVEAAGSGPSLRGLRLHGIAGDARRQSGRHSQVIATPRSPMAEALPFKTTMNFAYGVPRELMPGVVRIVANNPNPFTFKGTNTYLVGTRSLALIDPGPDDPAHLQAILEAAGD